MTWPKTADGDVFRSLESKGFDFTKVTKIDFEVDFKSWPPRQDALDILKKNYPSIEFIDTDESHLGYAHLEIHDFLTYELVLSMQERITALVSKFGGACEAWGVLSNES
jgi:hypothetical protein